MYFIGRIPNVKHAFGMDDLVSRLQSAHAQCEGSGRLRHADARCSQPSFLHETSALDALLTRS